MPAGDVLDNHVWHALARWPQHREGTPAAWRYRSDLAPFAALPDHPTPGHWAALARLVGPGNAAVLHRPDPLDVPDGWSVLVRSPSVQLRWVGSAPAGEHDGPVIEALGVADRAEMADLAARTEPGPFAANAADLGPFVGIRVGGALVAMAGERVRPPGASEVSAVCTDPAHRGKGLATLLVAHVVRTIVERGERPFLHARAQNVTAIRLYERMGFVRAEDREVLVVAAPA